MNAEKRKTTERRYNRKTLKFYNKKIAIFFLLQKDEKRTKKIKILRIFEKLTVFLMFSKKVHPIQRNWQRQL